MAQGFSDDYRYSSSYHNIGSGTGGGGSNEFTRSSQKIGTNIQKISQNVASIEKMVNQLGTPQDSESLRTQLHQVHNYTSQLVKDTNRHLKELATLPQAENPSEQKQRKVLKERLTNQFSEALKDFQSAQRLEAQKEKESVMRARANSGLRGDPFQDLGSGSAGSNLIELASPVQNQQQSQMALQMEEEINLTLLREREDAVRKLESDIVDVNSIFKDLATMVHEQGEIIDSIEANIESASVNVGEGVQQLSKARQSQRSARKKTCFLIVFLVIVLTVIVTVIVVYTK